MANEIESLVVKAEPRGLSEVSDGFAGMQGDLEEAEEAMQDTTGQLEEMSSKWTGLMSTLATGVAVSVGSLLSTVPVFGEALSGISSVLSAVGYQVDQLARDLGAGGFTETLYNVSGAIYDLDGTMGDLAGVFGVVASAVGGAVTAYISYIAYTQGLAAAGSTLLGGLSTIAGALSTVATAIAGVIAGASALTLAIGALVAGIVAFAVAWLTNWRNTRNKTSEIITQITEFFNNLVANATSAAQNIWSGVVGWFESIREDAGEALSNLVSDAKSYGASLISQLVSGIQNAIPDLSNILNQDIVAGVSVSDAISSVDGVISGNNSGGGNNNNGFSARRQGDPNVYLDGKDVTDNTGRYRRNATSRRGRDG